MTAVESGADRPDQPFPGAHPQVPGAHSLASDTGQPVGERQLPLESARTGGGVNWKVRLPVRAESVTVRKEVVVYERAVVRRRELGDVARVQDVVRREQLGVVAGGNAEFVEQAGDVGQAKPRSTPARQPM